jgi:hypothetical protein
VEKARSVAERAHQGNRTEHQSVSEDATCSLQKKRPDHQGAQLTIGQRSQSYYQQQAAPTAPHSHCEQSSYLSLSPSRGAVAPHAGLACFFESLRLSQRYDYRHRGQKRTSCLVAAYASSHWRGTTVPEVTHAGAVTVNEKHEEVRVKAGYFDDDVNANVSANPQEATSPYPHEPESENPVVQEGKRRKRKKADDAGTLDDPLYAGVDEIECRDDLHD